jgi:hypothetical protein
LRAQTLHDIDCWSNVSGQPIGPGLLVAEVERRLSGFAENGTAKAKVSQQPGEVASREDVREEGEAACTV